MSTPLVHLRDIHKRPAIFTLWEKIRNRKQVHWAMECMAEAMGVFFYVYFGIGSQVGWVVGNILKIQGFSSLFQIGVGYALGIIFAIGLFAGTSGGHFNPAVTITMVIFKGFPKAKAVRYLIAQILGAYIASLVVYAQWKTLIDVAEGILMEEGPAVFAATQFTPNGPPGAFGAYLLPGGNTIPRVFMNEFVNCTLIAMVIWGCLDPCNIAIPPAAAGPIIAFSYAAAIWGFGVPGVSLNAARDIGARLGVLTIWGMDAGGGGYSAISALVNIPATLLGAAIYEVFFVDSDRVVAPSHLEFVNHHANHRRLRRKANAEKRGSRVQSLVDLGLGEGNGNGNGNQEEKPTIATYENVNDTNRSPV